MSSESLVCLDVGLKRLSMSIQLLPQLLLPSLLGLMVHYHLHQAMCLLMDSHQKYATDVTDDAAMVEGLGHRVKIFMGSYTNIKITTSDDLIIAESLLRGHVSDHGE